MAKHLGNISKHQIWRVLRQHEISLERRRRWCFSTDPAFAPKAADIVALYLHPPENAVAGASFTSPRQVREQIAAFIAAHNHDAHPVEWTKQVVFSKHHRSTYANFRD